MNCICSRKLKLDIFFLNFSWNWEGTFYSLVSKWGVRPPNQGWKSWWSGTDFVTLSWQPTSSQCERGLDLTPPWEILPSRNYSCGSICQGGARAATLWVCQHLWGKGFFLLAKYGHTKGIWPGRVLDYVHGAAGGWEVTPEERTWGAREGTIRDQWEELHSPKRKKLQISDPQWGVGYK